MKKLLYSTILIMILAASAQAQSGPNYLFVINFDSGTYKDGKLTLVGNGQSNVIYFSDKPVLESGHMGIAKFVKVWGEGEENFNTTPPNSTLSVINDEKLDDSVLILSNPKVEGTSIVFDAELVKGKPASKFGPGGLFLDTKY